MCVGFLSADTWVVTSPPADSTSPDGIADVHSGAKGRDSNGVAYESY